MLKAYRAYVGRSWVGSHAVRHHHGSGREVRARTPVGGPSGRHFLALARKRSGSPAVLAHVPLSSLRQFHIYPDMNEVWIFGPHAWRPD